MGKKSRTPLFAALPLRALGDKRLSELHFRTLGAISHHDRMSLVRGSGAGCWASHETLSKEIGANKSNVSTAIGELRRYGYLATEPQKDRRFRVYRVIFEAAQDRDPLSNGNPSERGLRFGEKEPTIISGEKVDCPGTPLTDGNYSELSQEYIPQSGKGDSAKQEVRFCKSKKRNFAGASHLPMRSPRCVLPDLRYDQNFMRFASFLDQDMTDTEIAEWQDYLSEVHEDDVAPPNIRGWAFRLLEMLENEIACLA